MSMLICPACLPDENGLDSRIVSEQQADILEGSLVCRHCGREYAIQDGVAFLDPTVSPDAATSESKYETAPVLSSYLWSHYGDLLNDPDATPAYREWADQIHPHSGVALDAGSAVGRFAFEMRTKSERVVGIDNSVSFIRCARALMTHRTMIIGLKEEGVLEREVTISLPDSWDTRQVEFIVADAQALPFPAGTFSSLASLNLLDKVPMPIQHMKEMHRVAARHQTQMLISDPYSWSEEAAKEEDWLGGTDKGPFSGRGIENVKALLTRSTYGWFPPWRVEDHGHIWWKIRTHANHFELIRSCYVKAVR